MDNIKQGTMPVSESVYPPAMVHDAEDYDPEEMCEGWEDIPFRKE